MKKTRNIFFIASIMLYIVLVVNFATGKHNAIPCVSVDIQILNNQEASFITNDDVLNIITPAGRKLKEMFIDSINILQLEVNLLKHPAVNKAEVSKKIYKKEGEVIGELHVTVNQRKPVCRVFDKYNNSYYIDNEGYFMPISKKGTAHVLVVSGEIDSIILDSAELFHVRKSEKLNTIFPVASFIMNHEFWKSQIEQISIDSSNQMIMIPKVGAHQIYFGNDYNYENKFKKLEALYLKGLKHEDWNKYKSINLMYRNQVICSKW